MSGSNLSLAPDCIELALEAGCATLVGLQLSRASAAGDSHRTRQLTREIRLLRRVIDELRASHSASSSALAHGFVLCPADTGDRASFSDSPDWLEDAFA
jgi:hypothetical protein